jgi:hypothetical protein
MFISKSATRSIAVIAVATLLFVLVGAYAAGRRDVGMPDQQAVAPHANNPPPAPPHASAPPAPSAPVAVSTALSYYFIPASAFTPNGGSSPYSRQTSGCVNQMPLGFPFSAPVFLPQSSEVVSITLFSYNQDVTTTISTAYFIVSDGKGNGGYIFHAVSPANLTGYQQRASTETISAQVDSRTYNYSIQWVTSGSGDSPYLSLCGVQVAYHAPLSPAASLPVVLK